MGLQVQFEMSSQRSLFIYKKYILKYIYEKFYILKKK